MHAYTIMFRDGGFSDGYNAPSPRMAALQHISDIIGCAVPDSDEGCREMVSSYVRYCEADGDLPAEFSVVSDSTPGILYSFDDLRKDLSLS